MVLQQRTSDSELISGAILVTHLPPNLRAIVFFSITLTLGGNGLCPLACLGCLIQRERLRH